MLVSNHMIGLVAGDGIILVNEAILTSVASRRMTCRRRSAEGLAVMNSSSDEGEL